ncbi:MAG TPA: PD-(D/E)XK nuclease superfamily protein [Polyangiaceae bacterium]|nr:PD-(D/E)XK nuclease superfamily protein [Polyangiaceae bacterium]
MSGRGTAPSGGDALELAVANLAQRLGLEVRRQVKVGRRLWGAERRIDVVVTEPTSRRRLGLECKFQGVPGTAEEKIPTTIQDISAWPIPGLVVFSGEGFSPYMRSLLIASGRSVELEDLEAWLRLFFGLPLD